jgi:hypothetical protein
LGQAGFFYGKAIKIRFLQSKNPVNPVYPVKKDILRSEILKNMLVIFSQENCSITYNNHIPQVDTWQQQLETLVMAHQIIQDETISEVILKDASETAIGEVAISKYVDELMEFRKAWFACACK